MEVVRGNGSFSVGDAQQVAFRVFRGRSLGISVVTGVVTTANTAIGISCTAGRDSSDVNSSIDAASASPTPSVAPIVGGWIRS